MFNYLYHRSVKILCWKVNKNYSSHSSTLSKYSQDWLDIFLKRFDCVQNNWIANKTIGLNLLWDLYSEIKHKTHQIKRWADQCICNDQAWIKLIQWGVHHTFIHNRFWSCIDSCDVDTWVLWNYLFILATFVFVRASLSWRCGGSEDQSWHSWRWRWLPGVTGPGHWGRWWRVSRHLDS